MDLIRLKGQGCSLFKRDLKRAYRQLPVCPGDYNLLGYEGQHLMCVDRVLHMALHSAAWICQCVTNSVSFIYNMWGSFVVHYLDDFGGAEVWDKAQEAFEALIKVIKASELEESEVKTCGPSTFSVTDERLLELREVLKTWESKVWATKKDVQKLLW